MALFEFQDGEGTTFCCEGDNPPSSVGEGNATAWSGCDTIQRGSCDGAGGVAGVSGSGFNNQQVVIFCDNSAGGTDLTYVIGDPIGLLAELSGKTLSIPTTGNISPTIFNQYVGQRKYKVSSILIGVSDPTMFTQNIVTIVSGNVAGQICYTPLLSRIVSMNKQIYGDASERFLPMRPSVFLNSTTCIFVDVPAGETCSLAFS